MGMDISFSRKEALKAGYRLVKYWDDIIPGEEREGELFEWQCDGETIRQDNGGAGDTIIIQYLRNANRGEYLMEQLRDKGISCEAW